MASPSHTSITAAQCRAARALLDMTTAQLSGAAVQSIANVDCDGFQRRDETYIQTRLNCAPPKMGEPSGIIAVGLVGRKQL